MRICGFCARELSASEGHMAIETLTGRRILCHPCVRGIVQHFVGMGLAGPR